MLFIVPGTDPVVFYFQVPGHVVPGLATRFPATT